jgi:hypothetical protein
MAILWKFGWIMNTGFYWIPAWCVFFCLPPLLLLHKRWGRAAVPILAAIALVAGFASSIRANAGLPVLLAAFALVLIKLEPFIQRLVVVALILVSYMALNSFALSGVQRHRDAIIHQNLSATYPESHPVWHSAYLGLGYLDNRYRIRWDDATAFAWARHIDPKVELYSRQYESILKRRYFHILLTNPSFVLRTYATKTGVVVRHLVERYWLAFLALLSLGVLRRQRQDWFWKYAFLCTIAGIGAAVPPVLALPNVDFELGLLATCSVLALLILGRILGTAEDFLITRRVEVHRPSKVLAIGIGVAGAAGFISVSPTIKKAEATNFYRTVQGDFGSRSVGGSSIRRWAFLGSAPTEWFMNRDAEVVSHATRRIRLRTSRTQFAYELGSAGDVLSPGEYEAHLTGRVVKGGLRLGVLDAMSNRWITGSDYWWGQHGYGNADMVIQFALATTTKVRVVLSNFGLTPLRSLWDIKSVSLIKRRLTGCIVYSPTAWYTPKPLGVPQLSDG